MVYRSQSILGRPAEVGFAGVGGEARWGDKERTRFDNPFRSNE